MFEKYSNVKFHENPSSGSPVVPCGRTDRHDEATSRFRNFTNVLNNHYKYTNGEHNQVLLPKNLSLKIMVLLISHIRPSLSLVLKGGRFLSVRFRDYFDLF